MEEENRGKSRAGRQSSTSPSLRHSYDSFAAGVVYVDSVSARSQSAVARKSSVGAGASISGKVFFMPRRRMRTLAAVTVPERVAIVDLRSNMLEEVDCLFSATHEPLQVMYLRCNRIRAVPPSIGALRNLAELDLSGNCLRAVPAEIGQLGALRVLTLDDNEIKALPASIGTLNRLEVLSVRHNLLLGPLPVALSELHVLHTLDLGLNPDMRYLTTASLHGLRSLKKLRLWGSLRRAAQELADGRMDAADDGSASSQPPAPPHADSAAAPAAVVPVAPMTGQLRLQRSSLMGLRPIEETLHAICKFTSLVELDLRCNDLEDLPESLCNLVGLTSLVLSSNMLTHLPRDINRLQNLVMLDVSRNSLFTIPPQLARIPGLRTLLVVGNPIESPRYEVFTKGTAAVLEYFNDILPGKYFDSFLLTSFYRSCVADGSDAGLNVIGLRSILLSFPAPVILRHKEQVLSTIKAKLRSAPEAQLSVDARMHLILLACNNSQILAHSIERLEVIATENAEVIFAQDGVQLLSRVMNTCGDAALARKVAIVLTTMVSQCTLEIAAKVCQLGGRPFARYLVDIARRDRKYISSLMELAAQGSIEIHNRIRVRDVEFGKVIGKGASAVVYCGNYDGQLVAIKQFDIETIPDKEFRREVALLTLLNIPTVLGCIGASLRHGFVVMRYYELGNLYNLLHTDDGARLLSQAISGHAFAEVPVLRRLTLRRKILMLKTIADAVAYIHSLGIIHRDLKSDNILVSKTLSVCIADLGISRVVSDRMTQAMGTPRYMAPEVLEGKPYDVGADVYSFGILAWEILTQSLPFADMTTGWHVASAVIRGERPPIASDAIPTPLAQIVRACWDGEPQNRPTMKTVASQISKIISAVQMHSRTAED